MRSRTGCSAAPGRSTSSPAFVKTLGTVQQAQAALDATEATHVQAMRDFQERRGETLSQRWSAGCVEPHLRVRTNSTRTARELYDLVKSNPDALAGLRRGMIEHLDQRFNVEANPLETGTTIKSKQFRDFMDQHRGAFKAVFGGQGSQNIELVEAMLNRQAAAKQMEATVGSNTTRKALGAASHGHSLGEGTRTTLFALIGEHLAENAAHMLGGHGIMATVASGAGVAGGIWLNALRQTGIATRNESRPRNDAQSGTDAHADAGRFRPRKSFSARCSVSPESHCVAPCWLINPNEGTLMAQLVITPAGPLPVSGYGQLAVTNTSAFSAASCVTTGTKSAGFPTTPTLITTLRTSPLPLAMLTSIRWGRQP